MKSAISPRDILSMGMLPCGKANDALCRFSLPDSKCVVFGDNKPYHCYVYYYRPVHEDYAGKNRKIIFRKGA